MLEGLEGQRARCAAPEAERAAPAKPRCDFFGAGARGAGGESNYDAPHDAEGLSLPRYYWLLRVARVCLPFLRLLDFIVAGEAR